MAADEPMINEKEEPKKIPSTQNESVFYLRNSKDKEQYLKRRTQIENEVVTSFINDITKEEIVDIPRDEENRESKSNPLILPPGLDCNTLARLLIDVIGRKADEVRHEADRRCLIRACEILLSSSSTDEDDDVNTQHAKKFRKNFAEDICSSTESTHKEKDSDLFDSSKKNSCMICDKYFSDDRHDRHDCLYANHTDLQIPSKPKISSDQLDPDKLCINTQQTIICSSKTLGSAKSNGSSDTCELGFKNITDFAENTLKPTFHGRTLLKGPGIMPRTIPLDRLPQFSHAVDPRLNFKDSLEIWNTTENDENQDTEVNKTVHSNFQLTLDEDENLAFTDVKNVLPEDNVINYKNIPVVNTERSSYRKQMNVTDNVANHYVGDKISWIQISSSVNVISSELNQDLVYPLPMDSTSDDESSGIISSNNAPYSSLVQDTNATVCALNVTTSTVSVNSDLLPEEEVNPPLPPEEIHPPLPPSEEIHPPLPPPEEIHPPLPPPEEIHPPLPPPEESTLPLVANDSVMLNNDSYVFRHNSNIWMPNTFQWMPQIYNTMGQCYSWSSENNFQFNNFLSHNTVNQLVHNNIVNYNLPQSDKQYIYHSRQHH